MECQTSSGNNSIPKWAGKPELGYHLDVMKDGKLIMKFLIEKSATKFGRDTNNDMCTDHSSCSRVHAALVYHKHLNRFFLMDLGSTHGTFIGSIRLESNKPTQLTPGLSFRFGASTREYILREKPAGSVVSNPNSEANTANSSNSQIDSGDLPEDQIELDHLTEFNTANNKRISVLGIANLDKAHVPRRYTGNKSVRFKEEEDVINPEDVDPKVGKFRNLIQSAVIPSAKKAKYESDSFDHSFLNATSSSSKTTFNITRPDHSGANDGDESFNPLISKSVSLRLGINLPKFGTSC